ncbi:MAG: potassium transporter Kup [Thermaurantiacus sp.]
MLGALGVVFGDIGTSPIYALRETFTGAHALPVDEFHILGVVSLIFWSMLLIVSLKYVAIVLRADNRGQGGSIALLALLQQHSQGRPWAGLVVVLGILATSLFFGESMITPAISVLSAVEGVTVVEPGLQPLVIPVALGIIFGLFFIQSRGAGRVGAVFGPVTLVYFVVLAVLGGLSIAESPGILQALSPHHAVRFFATDGLAAFLSLSAVVLAITGVEALYADMGHFGRNPIAKSWFWIVLPALMLTYAGQGALLLREPEAVANPFFLIAPEDFRIPLIILATMATVIASQAVISGAFSVTRQVVQLGFLPRMRILHTSERAEGQIYIPFVNWTLLALVTLLVLGFQSSSNLAAAYGIAVTCTMFITTCMMAVLILHVWKWPVWIAAGVIGLYLVIDGSYLLANLTKIPQGGWFPLLIGTIAFTTLTTWYRGRQLMQRRLREAAMPMDVFIRSAARAATRVPGTAVFMTSTPEGVPPALLHNLKHNKILHERNMLLTIEIAEVPEVDPSDRILATDLGDNFWRVLLRYGFMEQPDVPAALKMLDACGPPLKMMETSFFLSRQTLLPAATPGMPLWREKFFAWMLRNAESAMEFFRIPSNRVVELGSQVEI